MHHVWYRWEPPEPDMEPESAAGPDLFVPILVGVSFGGYALILLYDVITNGLCVPGLGCSSNVASW